MAFSKSIYDLINMDSSCRDSQWEESFLKQLPSAHFRVLSESPGTGPDGWPYLLVEVDAQATEPVEKVLEWLSDKGIGLVINPRKEEPDFILSFGMVWHYREWRKFRTEGEHIPSGVVEYREGQKVLAGPPSEPYLPEYVRRILRAFFRDNGIDEMKILIMGQGQNFDLCFSLEACGNPPSEEHTALLEAISWFLPRHYSLVLVSETGLPPFHSL